MAKGGPGFPFCTATTLAGPQACHVWIRVFEGMQTAEASSNRKALGWTSTVRDIEIITGGFVVKGYSYFANTRLNGHIN